MHKICWYALVKEVLFLQACLYRDTRRLCTGFLFKMYSSSILLLGLLCPAIQAGPYANLPPISYTVEDLGIATDPTNNYNGVYHDGGGGASQNGYHVQVYADSSTTSEGFNFVTTLWRITDTQVPLTLLIISVC